MTASGTGTLTLLGASYSARYWTMSAMNTHALPTDPAGEWHLAVSNGMSIVASRTGDGGENNGSPTGELGFIQDSQVIIHWRDAPGESPFVVLRLADNLEGLAMQARYACSVTQVGNGEWDHVWTDWLPLAWDSFHKGYVGIGPASDGSIGAQGTPQERYWGFIQLRLDDSSDWTMASAKLGWINLG
jgi:hypothetical protein